MGTIDDLLSKGDIAGGPRSREKALALLPDFKASLGLTRDQYNDCRPAMETFIADVVLGAAWYQKHYMHARSIVHNYIAINCLAVIAIPLAILGLARIGGAQAIISQLVGVLTGILSLQKTLAAWYASQQRYAAWYQCAANLKSIYYSFVQDWAERVSLDKTGFKAALINGSGAARQIMQAEQYDYYQKLALPSFDILDLLTSSTTAASSFVTSLIPGTALATVTGAGKYALATPTPVSPPQPLPGPHKKVGSVIVPGGRRHHSRVRYVTTKQFNFRPKTFDFAVNREIPGLVGNSNWICAGYCKVTSGSIQVFRTTWTVPPNPTNQASQVIFLFSGCQPADASLILQPVLQWGDSGVDADGQDDTGQFWTITSWLVGGPDGNANHCDYVRVNPGDVLTGVVTLVSSAEDGYVYSCEFENYPSTKLTTPPIPELVTCVAVLEAYECEHDETPPYDLDSPSEYPASQSVQFDQITLGFVQEGSIQEWQGWDIVTTYGESAVANGGPTNGFVHLNLPPLTA